MWVQDHTMSFIWLSSHMAYHIGNRCCQVKWPLEAPILFLWFCSLMHDKHASMLSQLAQVWHCRLGWQGLDWIPEDNNISELQLKEGKRNLQEFDIIMNWYKRICTIPDIWHIWASSLQNPRATLSCTLREKLMHAHRLTVIPLIIFCVRSAAAADKDQKPYYELGLSWK